ncbi:MAG TPA: 3-oxoacyl-ACP reductase family protein [Pirellulales bacterium]|jgi:NAD(P)-dependent dehydrogenase (short-subunit alcohol dehydrogenase family)|nr:3-oxoacyl-ACP reductase family protein [Pirellulales bacterium]
MPTHLFDLRGRVALVTGGSKGLGKAMARGLAEAGAQIAISSRHEDELKEAAAEIARGTDVKVAYFKADMSKRDEVRHLAERVLAEFGRVDILINNAGGNRLGAIDKISDEDWDSVIEVNLTSCMVLTRALVPQMKERRWGRIIHISSIMGLASKEERDVYSATKSALLGLARASALDVGAFGITVNCLAPGPFLTDLPGKLLNDEQKQVFASRTALGRWAEPSELAGPALLLASEAGGYITGTVIVVDGGTLIKTF